MKKKILFVIAMMFIFTSGVKALEGEYEQEYTVSAVNQYDEERNNVTVQHLLNKQISNCNEDFSICDVLNEDYTTYTRTKINWAPADESIASLVTEFVNTNFSEKKNFSTSGLNALLADKHGINYYRYNEEFQNIFKNSMFRGDIQEVSGAIDEFYLGADGTELFISYNGVVYGAYRNRVTLDLTRVIYIPADTEDTPEAFVAAVDKLLEQYGETSGLVPLGLIDELEFADYYTKYGAKDTMSPYYYGFEGDPKGLHFLIVKDSTKVNDPVLFTEKDVTTNVSVSTNSAEVPMDATLEVSKVLEDNSEYQRITNVLKTTDVAMYDLKVHSKSLDKYITNLGNGKFIVSIPVPENLQGKDLVAYYVKDDNTIETYDVTVKDNIATFETSHFSIYTLAVKPAATTTTTTTTANPNTLDNITSSILMLGISLITLTGSLIIKKRLSVR